MEGPGKTNGATATSTPFFAGRLSRPMSNLLRENNERPRLAWEVKNLDFVLRVDCAHAVMLAQQSLITEQQARALLNELEALRNGGASGFSTEPGYGSIVLQIEKILADRLGENVAGRLSIARSRLDQGTTVWRMSDRLHVRSVIKDLVKLQNTIINVAEQHGDTAVISYTHLQQAQPATFGHYLLAFRDRLQDSFAQLTELYQRIDRCPLGAVGLSGTDLPIDRQRTASLLGFSELLENSRLGRDAYYQIEAVFALAMTFSILNDICTELHIYSSAEFGTIELDDSHCSTSSVFPQKKNPYALETVKGKAGEAQGWVTSAFAIFRNEGTHDHANRCLSFLNDACNTTSSMLQLTAEIIEKLTVHKDRYEDLLGKAWVTTNRLGNFLLKNHGMSYRAAHGVVARLVRNCLDRGIRKADVTVDMLQEAADQMHEGIINMSQDELVGALDHSDFIRHCNSQGGIGPDEFSKLLLKSNKTRSQNETWIVEKDRLLEHADQDLWNSIAYYIEVGDKGPH